ncbi:MAG: aminotransferase class I/II-fold pyridoxal phosphate-dependent enzyme [Thermodesulfobacteriota bacterium]
MIQGHGGNVYALAKRLNCPVNEIVDLSSNLNPLGPPPGLYEYLIRRIEVITSLPEVDAFQIRSELGEHLGVDPRRLLAASGTTQFIYALPGVLGIRSALILGPTYADYMDACSMNGCRHDLVLAAAENEFEQDMERIAGMAMNYEAVFICNPNNPTGGHIPGEMLSSLCRACPETVFVIDESYLPFHPGGKSESLIPINLPNAVILHSLSKIYKIPGLRIGFLIAEPGMIEKFQPHLLPWSVNSLACAAVDYLTAEPEETETFVRKSIRYIQEEKEWIVESLKHVAHIRLFPGKGPFMLARLAPGLTAEDACQTMAEHKILIRNCSNFHGLTERDIRFSFKNRDIHELLVQALAALG